MEKKHYAHSKPGRPKEEWQTIEDHLRSVAEKAATFASLFGGHEWARVAGALHDIGKYSREFQNMLVCSLDEDTNDEEFEPGHVIKCGPDHSSAGAQEAVKRLPEGVGRMIAYCVAGHHAGLLDPGINDEEGLKRRLKKSLKDYSACPSDIFRLPAITTPSIVLDKKEAGFQLQFYIRMLFSCLIDADFLDTEAFIDPKKAELRKNTADLRILCDKVMAEVAALSNDSSAVNKKRQEIFTQCRTAAEKSPGVFSLTVPTGGGKTLSSLAFALEHAVRYGMERVIYIIPYTSIIEQNADVFRKVCGDSAVLEHHCNFEAAHDSYRSQLAAENWDAPIIVTTNVQFFESLFHCRVSKCRKLHNIANSVIIFDEAQMLPVNKLKPCLSVIRELARNYRSTILLCTATQPALAKSGEFTCGLEGVREIISDPQKLYESLRRVTITRLPQMSDIDLARHISSYQQVLCVVNTRKHARELYNAVSEKNGLYHLSALMCPIHRSKTIAKIKTALREGNPCRVISTQLIEAGVDVDFPVVFRAQAGVDSIAQSAGRCNREGRLGSQGKVFVFDTEKLPPPGFLRQAAETACGVMNGRSGKVFFTKRLWVE